jgi:hypothetical protein
MANLHASLGGEAGEEAPHLVGVHTVVPGMQLRHDLGHRSTPVAQTEDGRARAIQDRDRLRREQDVPFARRVECQPDV